MVANARLRTTRWTAGDLPFVTGSYRDKPEIQKGTMRL